VCEKKIYFGAGGAGKNYILNTGEYPDFFLDNDVEKWGEDVLGVTVLDPNALTNMDDVKVYMTSWDSSSILKQVRSLGVDESSIIYPPKHFFGCHPFMSDFARTTTAERLYGFMTELGEEGPVVSLFGTALGFVRDGDFIKWDTDVDLVAHTSTRKKILFWLKERNIFFKKNEAKVEFSFDLGKEVSVPVSVEFYSPENSFFEPEFGPGWKFPVGMFFGCERKLIHGFELNVPSPAEKYLDIVYGPGWAVPNKEFSNDDYMSSN